MIAFEIWLNGEKLCVAGVGKAGVLSQHLTWVGGKPRTDTGEERQMEKPALRVGGLVNDEHVNWLEPRREVEVGDEVRLIVVEVESADEPIQRKRRESGEERAQKVRDGLAQTKALLPSPLAEGAWLASARGYDELLAAGEPEMAVKTLARLGDLNACPPDFWEALLAVARDLQMYGEAKDYRKKSNESADEDGPTA